MSRRSTEGTRGKDRRSGTVGFGLWCLSARGRRRFHFPMQGALRLVRSSSPEDLASKTPLGRKCEHTHAAQPETLSHTNTCTPDRADQFAMFCLLHCTVVPSASLSRAIPRPRPRASGRTLGGASPVGVGHPVCSTRTPVCAGPQVALPEAKTPGSRGDPVQRAFTKTWDKHAPAVASRRTASTIWALAAGSALQQCFNNSVFRIAHVHGKAGSGRGG
jgi:hypothetical protein